MSSNLLSRLASDLRQGFRSFPAGNRHTGYRVVFCSRGRLECRKQNRIPPDHGKVPNELGYICASTDYRLPGPVRFSDSPGVTAFDQLQDIRESYDRFVSLLKTMGRPLKIAVFGTSAGAHLASLLLCAAPGECGEHCELRNEWVKPSCRFLQSMPVVFEPWQDIFPQIWHAMQFFAAGCMYETNPKRFQAFSLAQIYSQGQSAAAVSGSGKRAHVPLVHTLELVREHNSLGIPSQWKVYKNAEHGFLYSLERPVQRKVFDDIQRFIAGKSVN
ncbi:MAG: hypothetical protein V8T87_11025 [Victivallales bacterium]